LAGRYLGLGPGLGGNWERVVPHYPPKLLLNTQQARQFEFHPSLPEVLLVGDMEGGVNVVNTEAEGERRPPLVVDHCQVLGLAWMRHHPQVAACGVANSGRISFLHYDPCAGPRVPALRYVCSVSPFAAPLSSLSINCSDDFMLVSGSACDVALYDMHSGKVLQQGFGLHCHLINISRFAHGSPHIFATASLDHTCKVWDLRQPLLREKAVRVLQTSGPNVMCAFCPDDRHLLCSGIDDELAQFELPSFRKVPSHFPLRKSLRPGVRFRRSTYLAGGRHFVTGATGESHIRVLSVRGEDLGAVDFRGLRRHIPSQGTASRASPPVVAGGCFGDRLQRAMGRERPHPVREAGPLVGGKVQLRADVLGPEPVSVQSVKAHPVVENRVGVLLAPDHSDQQSYVALLHLDPNYSRAG